MCQMSIYVKEEDVEKCVMENATSLAVSGDQVTIATLFDEPKEISGVRVQSIDFLSGRLVLQKQE